VSVLSTDTLRTSCPLISTAAQAAEKVYRVGILAPEGMHAIETFKEGLRQLGWIEGQNIRFDYRTAGGDDARQPALAAELVALPVDLILTWARQRRSQQKRQQRPSR
jgi:ABC-type uncharacterized transport system substrate-binding protein